MALGPTILKYGKWLVRAAAEAATWQVANQEALFTSGVVVQESIPFMRVQMTYNRADTTGNREDVMTNTLSIVNVTADAPDGTWTTTDFTQCETALDAYVTAHLAYWPANQTMTGYRWYLHHTSDPLAMQHPPARITAKSLVGTASQANATPRQVAETVTFRTASRKHWGRIYLPGFVDTQVDSNGRIPQATVDAMATAADGLVDALAANDFVLSVWSRTGKALLGIDQVQVDDVFDVIRSRRTKTTGYRKTLNT